MEKKQHMEKNTTSRYMNGCVDDNRMDTMYPRAGLQGNVFIQVQTNWIHDVTLNSKAQQGILFV